MIDSEEESMAGLGRKEEMFESVGKYGGETNGLPWHVGCKRRKYTLTLVCETGTAPSLFGPPPRLSFDVAVEIVDSKEGL